MLSFCHNSNGQKAVAAMMDGPFFFRRHARNGMRQHRITEEQVIVLLRAPAKDRANHEGKERREAWGQVSGG